MKDFVYYRPQLGSLLEITRKAVDKEPRVVRCSDQTAQVSLAGNDIGELLEKREN